MYYRSPESERDWRWLAVRVLTMGGLIVLAVVLGLVILGMLDGGDADGSGFSNLLVLLLVVATILAAIAVYGAHLRRLPLIWAPGIALLILAVPWASFWPFLIGAGMVGLAAAIARPERPPADSAMD